jgi:hypothetical protein
MTQTLYAHMNKKKDITSYVSGAWNVLEFLNETLFGYIAFLIYF